MSQHLFPERRDLYRWQLDALISWLACGRRGVIEAVTGSGKTDVAIAAVHDARRRGRFVLVVVPSRVLIEQWCARLGGALPDARIGRLGDGATDTPADCDVLVATRHSAAAYKPQPPCGRGGLLIADECHGLGGATLRGALLAAYEERLGLTATLERADDGVTDLLLPYFGGLCFRYDFADAIADGVCAQPRVAFVGVALSVGERADYAATESHLVEARQQLRQVRDMPLEPFGAFLAAVGHLALHDGGADGRAARAYLDSFSKRRQIVAQSSGKYELLGRFAPAIRAAHGTLVFTETVRAANHAINRLDPLVSIDLITGSTARRYRREILADLRNRKLDAVAAPRVLDEGIDVPDANLGIVMSGSRTRRQMIQRMGRILRRKESGVGARFVIMFARDTIEDPGARTERDGFVEELERISEASAVFDADRFEEVDRFLDHPGPVDVPEPQRLGPFRHAPVPKHLDRPLSGDLVAALASGDGEAWGGVAVAADRSGALTAELTAELAAELTERLGHEALYAHLSMVTWDRAGRLHEQVWAAAETSPTAVTTGVAAPAPRASAGASRRPVAPPPYLELAALSLPVVATPRVAAKRLSTGDRPLQLTPVGSAWRISCTGCGESSDTVRFRWQALELTVDCRCA